LLYGIERYQRFGKGEQQIITKGAIEEMLSICTHVEYKGEILPFDKELFEFASRISRDMDKQGMRVLAVAHKL